MKVTILKMRSEQTNWWRNLKLTSTLTRKRFIGQIRKISLEMTCRKNGTFVVDAPWKIRSEVFSLVWTKIAYLWTNTMKSTRTCTTIVHLTSMAPLANVFWNSALQWLKRSFTSNGRVPLEGLMVTRIFVKFWKTERLNGIPCNVLTLLMVTKWRMMSRTKEILKKCKSFWRNTKLQLLAKIQCRNQPSRLEKLGQDSIKLRPFEMVRVPCWRNWTTLTKTQRIFKLAHGLVCLRDEISLVLVKLVQEKLLPLACLLFCEQCYRRQKLMKYFKIVAMRLLSFQPRSFVSKWQMFLQNGGNVWIHE